MPESILVTGASGFFGGTFLDSLLKSDLASHHVYALVRTEEHAAAVKQLGAAPVIASLGDRAAVMKAVAGHTIRFVVNLANTFDVDYSTNLIDGLAQTKATTGEDVYFLSVFGGSSYADVSGWPKHDYPVEDNSEIHDKEKSLATSMQRKNAVQIREIAESRGVGGAYGTVCLAFGAGTGPVSRISTQIPALIRSALKNKSVNYIEGAAAKAWSYVHVVDIASFYLLALRKALDGTLETGPKRGNYFLEGGSLTWGVSANALASYMHAKGLVDSPSASAWTVEEASPELGFPAAFTNVLWGSHAVVQGTHSRQLGWTPKYTVDWLVQNLQTELDQI